MKAKKKNTLFTISFFAFILLLCIIWLSLRPVDIVAIHHRSRGFSDILVRNFPFTDEGKINWWLENKKMLEKEYQTPKPDIDGSFYLTFWLFGEGYKEEGKYDRLCFKDMKPPINCIEKDRVFSVQTGRKGNLLFTVNDKIYRMKKNGEIVRDTND